MISEIIELFQVEGKVLRMEIIHGGLINQTWKVITSQRNYLLQTVNQQVFKNPLAIADNVRMIGDYLAKHFPNYIFTQPVPTRKGGDLVYLDNYVYRAFPFIPDSHTISVVEHAAQAGEAAMQFGKFTAQLKNFQQEKLNLTLPDFHNLGLRYRQFLSSIHTGNKQRMKDAAEEIQQLKTLSSIVDQYNELLGNPGFQLRVTHHDTKISNVLFDENDRGLCVIDLDTIMPGYFISDVGDMMRTYLSPASEEEQEFDKISIRTDIYTAIRNGYLTEMQTLLSATELSNFNYSGRFMIYMQALRFITDYFNNDSYYGERYPGHNLIRAQNQLRLLKEYDQFIASN